MADMGEIQIIWITRIDYYPLQILNEMKVNFMQIYVVCSPSRPNILMSSVQVCPLLTLRIVRSDPNLIPFQN